MKKKIILALTACLFAAGTIINMHLAQNNHTMDVSLADISVMAQARGEEPEIPTGKQYWYYGTWGQKWLCCDASHSSPCSQDPACPA